MWEQSTWRIETMVKMTYDIYLRYHFVREYVEDRVVQLIFVKSEKHEWIHLPRMSYKRDWRKMLSKIWLQGKVEEDQEDKKDKDKKGSGASLKKGGYQSSSKIKLCREFQVSMFTRVFEI